MDVPNNFKPYLCKLDDNDCVSLVNIIKSFNTPVSEEHAWALCYQCAKCFKNAFEREPNKCRVVKNLEEVRIHKDGFIHPSTILNTEELAESLENIEKLSNENDSKTILQHHVIASLGYIVFQVLDFGIDEDEERSLNPELESLIKRMIASFEYGLHAQSMDHGQSGETDDEGIERDSAECEEISRNNFATFDDVLEECSRHIGVSGLGSETHYKAVCRALVAEALELSSFLDKLSDGTVSLRHRNSTSAELSTLDYSDWPNRRKWSILQARLWIQLIRELRRGVQLKKVDQRSHTGDEFVEYALTPYEMLMDDIRSRRYTLKRVTPPEIPARIQRDAHDAILEFIRSRPPLKSAAARKLAPRQQDKLSPREHLLECIKSGNVKLRSTSLTKSPFRNIKSSRSMSSPPNRSNKSKIHYDDSSINNSEEEYMPNQSIKSMLDPSKERKLIKVDFSALARLVSSDSEDDFDDDEEDNKFKTTTEEKTEESTYLGVSTQEEKHGPTETKFNKNIHAIRKQQRRHTIADQSSLSFIKPMGGLWKQSRRQSMYKNTLPTSDCLTLTLQELIHIRSVLTKAEIESLPVEGNFKEDVENRKVCFLCMKTRFGIFGPWGQECKMCQRTVCSKCCTKMRMPTDHLSQIPVVALSPNVAISEQNPWWSKSSWGSAPSSPQKATVGCPNNSMSASYHGSSTVTQNITRTKYSAQMAVCLDCKTMVLQEIKTSRVNRSNLLRHLTLDLSSVY
ncbi:protein spire isoform X1 [Acyrthosiphon pisum]|uniref:KIND domain-containing protein n=1 Tax=Acyrthosiphon pisum TaxID=7029 RepID=A0A8R2B761_ACYPI|nr:protein spire isoform X1 [Acyrthosiphon pisum]|eukprot:XP_008184579.1 PREDICTED: protein spire isoform X1 [Acyrthosiphon pisum]